MLTLGLALAAAIQPAPTPPPPPPPPPPSGSDIVVEGERTSGQGRAIGRQIDQILPDVPIDQPVARFQTALCPGVAGLERDTAQAVVDRIGEIAAALGLAIGEPGCDANLLLIVTDDAAAAIRRLVARRPGNFAAQTLADLRRIRAEPGPARGWVEEEIRSRDGERLILDPTGPAMLEVRTAGRAVLGFRRDIVSAVVMIDAAGVEGRDVVQIADYAAMRGLTGARPERLRHGRTILAAFSPAADGDAPAGLTELDWGILRGLYAGRGNRPSGLTRGAMIRQVLSPGTVPDEVPVEEGEQAATPR